MPFFTCLYWVCFPEVTVPLEYSGFIDDEMVHFIGIMNIKTGGTRSAPNALKLDYFQDMKVLGLRLLQYH